MQTVPPIIYYLQGSRSWAGHILAWQQDGEKRQSRVRDLKTKGMRLGGPTSPTYGNPPPAGLVWLGGGSSR